MKIDSTHAPRERLVLGLAVALILFAAFFRVFRLEFLPGLPNFSPVMAIALCGALVLPGTLAMVVPLIALVASDILLNLHFGLAPLSWAELLRYACYGLGVSAGLMLRRTGAGAPAIFGTVVANAIVFYLVTNTAAWFGNPAYVQTAVGWLQSLTVGLPGFPPTWVFFRNSLAGDLVFTSVFLGAMALASRSSDEPVPARSLAR